MPNLLTLVAHADLSLQDEVQFAFHPTLTRVWCLKGRRGQRLVEAPGDNRKVYGFGLVDWRDGWFDGRVAPGRTADVFCEQVRAAVTIALDASMVKMVDEITARLMAAFNSKKSEAHAIEAAPLPMKLAPPEPTRPAVAACTAR